MALTPFRWLAALIAACLMSAVIILRPDHADRRYDRGPERRLANRADLYAQHAGVAAGRLRLAQLLDSTRVIEARPADAPPIRMLFDAAFPPNVRVALDSFGTRAVREVRDSGHVGIDILFLYDTVKSLRGATLQRYGTEVDYVLPRSPSERCTVVARVAVNPDLRSQIVRVFRSESAAEELLGPCAYYRAFGIPGPHIDTWLRTRGWSFANVGSWRRSPSQVDLAASQFLDVGSTLRYALGVSSVLLLGELDTDAAQCAWGQPDGCDRAILSRRPRGAPTIWQGNVLYKSYPVLGRRWVTYFGKEFGRREPSLMASMVRTLGRERFARFWTSNDPVPAAFATAAGEPLSEWTSRWIIDQYGPVPPRGPGISGWAGILSAGLVLLAAFIALRVNAHRRFA